MRGHKYEIELGGSRCADLTNKKCPQFISKANPQRQSSPKGGREMSQGYTAPVDLTGQHLAPLTMFYDHSRKS